MSGGPVTLTIVADEFEAERVLALLGGAGIEAFASMTDFGAVASLGAAGGGPLEIRVAESDLDRAQALLEAE